MTHTEPVRLTSLVTAALLATTALIGLLADLEPAVIAALDAVLAAWVLVIGEAVRARVWSPRSHEHAIAIAQTTRPDS